MRSAKSKCWIIGGITLGVIAVTIAIGIGARYERMSYESVAMEPTISQGDIIWVDKRAFKSPNDVERWNIVLFKDPINNAMDVKRIIALPGETVALDQDGVIVSESSTFRPPPGIPWPAEWDVRPYDRYLLVKQYMVPVDAFLVIGDNHTGSSDSRNFGHVDFDRIKGKIVNAGSVR